MSKLEKCKCIKSLFKYIAFTFDCKLRSGVFLYRICKEGREEKKAFDSFPSIASSSPSALKWSLIKRDAINKINRRKTCSDI